MLIGRNYNAHRTNRDKFEPLRCISNSHVIGQDSGYILLLAQEEAFLFAEMQLDQIVFHNEIGKV